MGFDFDVRGGKRRWDKGCHLFAGIKGADLGNGRLGRCLIRKNKSNGVMPEFFSQFARGLLLPPVVDPEPFMGAVLDGGFKDGQNLAHLEMGIFGG